MTKHLNRKSDKCLTSSAVYNGMKTEIQDRRISKLQFKNLGKKVITEKIPLANAEPFDVIPTAEPKDIIPTAEPVDFIPTAEPKDDIPTTEPKDIIPIAEPVDVIPTDEPKDVMQLV